MSISSCLASSLCLPCVRVDLARARVWKHFWLQAPRTIGRAARNTAKFGSIILLEKHKEPKLRFGLRATRIAISVITPDRRYCRPPAVCIFVNACHQQLLKLFFLLTLASRSTQEPLFAFGLVCMSANQFCFSGARLIGSQRGDQLKKQYYYKQRLRKMATTCLTRCLTSYLCVYVSFFCSLLCEKPLHHCCWSLRP